MKVVVILALALAGCAKEPNWQRVSGTESQEIVRTICQGEMDKTALQSPRHEIPIVLSGPTPLQSVYEGCMAQHGYVAR